MQSRKQRQSVADKRIREELERLKRRLAGHPKGDDNNIPAWKREIPTWSHWEPGMPGNPSHRACLGTGYYRLDLPLGDPHFGDVLICECVPEMQERKAQALRRAATAAETKVRR